MSTTFSELPRKAEQSRLELGTYYIANNQNPDMVLDLAGYDLTTILAYGTHGGDNQKWEFAKLGAGYSIQSKHNGSFITLKSDLAENGGLVATPYPVSWDLEADPYEAGLWRIRWPRSSYVFNQPDEKGHIIQLNNTHPFKPTCLWRLIPVEPQQNETGFDALEFTTSAPKKLKVEPPALTTADTVIDVEGLKLGGNGEMSITTTTTTVTTSVTKVKRLGVP